MPHGASTTRPQLELDHLVVAARTLDEGAAWCEATLGVMPEAGGRHAWMGTHNRLLSLSSACLPKCYLEIVAIDPQAPAPWRKRWFDLDTPEVREAIATSPRLVHWVARTHAIDADAKAFRDAGYDVGQPIVAERATPRGMLRWRITVRDDGGRPAGGAVPLLIEWGDEHPCDALPASGSSSSRSKSTVCRLHSHRASASPRRPMHLPPYSPLQALRCLASTRRRWPRPSAQGSVG